MVRLLTVAAAAVCLIAGSAPVAAQQPTLTPDDYGRWEDLGSSTLSPDGAWLAYTVARVDEQNELRIRYLDEDSVRVVPWGMSPEFAANSDWLAWAVDVSEEERERLEERNEPVRQSAGLLDLSSGEEREFEDVRGFDFDGTGRFLALHGYAPEEPEGKGADLRVLDLGTGTTITFGNVGEYAWSDAGSLLALAIATGDQADNGVQLYDAETGRLSSLDASESAYRQLAWRRDAADLAVLRSRDAASEDDATAHDALAWHGLDAADAPGSEPLVLAAETPGVADTLEVVQHAAPRWSDDGTMIAVGLRPAEPDEEDEEGEGEETEEEAESEGEDDTGDTEEGQDEEEDAEAEEAEEPELPGLQIWHSSDRRIFPRQQSSRSFDERRTLLAVWHLDENRVVRIGTDLMASARLLEGWRRAVEESSEPYAWGDMFGRPYHDTWVVDVASGEREMVAERVRYDWTSDGGGWLVTFDGSNYASLDLETGERYDLTSELPTVFADTTYDTPTDLLPPHGFGPGGWLADDAAVFLYDEHDVWRVAPDGSSPERITRGLEADVTHRLIREFDFDRREMVAFGDDDDEPGFDPEQPLYLSLYGERTEKRGYGRLPTAGGDAAVERLVYADAYISGLARADSAEVYKYGAQAFDDPPDLFVAGPDLSDARQVTEINPFIDEYAWGRAELIDFTSEAGRELQAVLLYPANHRAGERVPMIVYTYEMLSPQMHFFRPPSERRYYNFTVWTQEGYAVLLPDIVYRARDPGVSALESVRAAVARVVEMGVADADRVGLIGHSWGGYQATFLPTRTDIFAASVAGAPLTDFVSFMGAIHWNPGVPEVDHWETGQARMEVPFWDDPEAHRRNSPIHEVHEMETPLLMAFGNEDGVVDWDQGTEFYNFARRAGKQMVLLVYEGEDHGFRQEANQVDYHRRILEWFGHYLKGEPAPEWITEGVPLDELEDEKERVARKGPIH